MKKTVKILSIAVALAAGINGTAHADGFKIGADAVSSYVWRGTEYGDSAAIQPAISYTLPGSGVVVGAWGSYGFVNNLTTENGDKFRYQETDLYVTVPAGPFNLTVTNYFIPVPDNNRTFDFSNDGPNTIEVSAGYSKNNLSLLAAINIAGFDYDHAKYLEAGYKIYDNSKYTAKAFIGAGDEIQYAPEEGTGFRIVNVGMTVTKDSYSASYVYNPATEKSNLGFMFSF